VHSKVFVEEENKAAVATPFTKEKGSKDGKIPEDPKDDEDKDPKDAKDAKDPKDATKVKDGSRRQFKPEAKKTLKTAPQVDEDDDEDAAPDAPKDGKDGKQSKEVIWVSPEDVAVDDSEQEAGEDDALAKDKAAGEAEAVKVEGQAGKPLKTRVEERKKATTIQRSLVKMFNQMTSTKNEDGVMLFSPGQKNVSSTVINQMIEEVEKRLKARSVQKVPEVPTQEDLKGLTKRMFQD
jgi:hypothetical protein